jgi:60S ribosome subunit biogenesis protein NIP7
VFYVREAIAAAATSIARDNLASLGLCVGKFTHSGRFQVHITFLPYLAPFAKVSKRMTFLVGNHVSQKTTTT